MIYLLKIFKHLRLVDQGKKTLKKIKIYYFEPVV